MTTFTNKPTTLDKQGYLKGRTEPMPVPEKHWVLGSNMCPPYPEGLALAMFGMGCFWGAERLFWQLDGAYVTAVGYASGFTPNPNYNEVCSGFTGHNEVLRLVYDPQKLSYKMLLTIFWQSHNPTQGMRQGNDIGTQYRSAIYYYDSSQENLARHTLQDCQLALKKAGFGPITTEILPAPQFYFAEEYHQQYLAKNPNGYCGLGGTGILLADVSA